MHGNYRSTNVKSSFLVHLAHLSPPIPAPRSSLSQAGLILNSLDGARCAEAICVLAPHDKTLYQVTVALDRRLRPLVAAPRYDGSPDSAYPSPVSSLSSLTSTSPTSASPPPAFQEPPEPNVTGKGLDALIESVKRRTGASPFIRGKHPSLDPFGAPGGDHGIAPAAAPVYHPTFQAPVCWGGNSDALDSAVHGAPRCLLNTALSPPLISTWSLQPAGPSPD